MTDDDLIYRFRLALFAEAGRLGNVRAACRVFGVHPSTYYRLREQVVRCGLDMLRPRERRPPRMPNQASQVVEQRVAVQTTLPVIDERSEEVEPLPLELGGRLGTGLERQCPQDGRVRGVASVGGRHHDAGLVSREQGQGRHHRIGAAPEVVAEAFMRSGSRCDAGDDHH